MYKGLFKYYISTFRGQCLGQYVDDTDGTVEYMEWIFNYGIFHELGQKILSQTLVNIIVIE